jgi:phosphotransferase system HPr (HPr) family protein
MILDGTLHEPLIRRIEITMPNRLGFHLRVVARFVQCVRGFRSIIRIRKGKLLADGKSILGLLILGAAWKSKLEIEAVGDDAVQAIEEIKDFFLNQEKIGECLR